MIILELYRLTEELITKIMIDNNISNNIDDDNSIENSDYKDLLSDCMALGKDLLHKLDPSIRGKIAKKGISFTHNIYTGFDTEFINVDAVNNKLISVQLAVTSKTLVQFPGYNPFNFKEIDTLSGKELKSTVKNCKNFDSVAA